MSKKKATTPRAKTTLADREAKLQAQLKTLQVRKQIADLRASLKK